MTDSKTGRSHACDDDPGTDFAGRPGTVLLIGRDSAGPSRHFARHTTPVVVAPFGTLDAALLARIAPRAVGFPLMGGDCDAAQVLSHLATLGFDGEAIVFAPRLPDREMVLRELRPLAPGLAALTLLDLPEA